MYIQPEDLPIYVCTPLSLELNKYWMAMDISNSFDSNNRSNHDCLLLVRVTETGDDWESNVLQATSERCVVNEAAGDATGLQPQTIVRSASSRVLSCSTNPESQLPTTLAPPCGTDDDRSTPPVRAVSARCGRSTSVTRPLSTERLRLSLWTTPIMAADILSHDVMSCTLTRRSNVIVMSPHHLHRTTHTHTSVIIIIIICTPAHTHCQEKKSNVA